MVEEGIRGRMCHVVHRYAKANNKYVDAKFVCMGYETKLTCRRF